LQPLDQIGSIGSPTTVVYATELSGPAILDGIRAGHVFVDVAGSHDRLLEVTAQTANQTARAGDRLDASQGETVQLEAHVAAAAGGRIRWILDGEAVAPAASASVPTADEKIQMPWKSDGQRHWFRAEVVGPDGKLWLIGNPIYVNWLEANKCN
jgi:hypothetical protein